MNGDVLTDLIEGSDLDGLVRYVDGACSARDWDEVMRVQERCGEAVKRGKQVWGASHYAAYRTALEAPGQYVGLVVVEGAGRFSLGPLWEVAASTHSWAELADHLEHGPVRGLAAHERAIRGDDIGDLEDLDVLAIPPEPEPWEPRYPLAIFRSDAADFPESPATTLQALELGEPGEPVEDEDVIEALYQIARPWAEQSDGHVEVVAVRGDAESAIRSLGVRRVFAAEIAVAEAMAMMTWTAASGGAFGRRRGTAVGRSVAWWALAAVCGLDDVEPDEIAVGMVGLRWVRFNPADQSTGWNFHLAVEDPQRHRAWAVSAVDATG